MVLNDKKSILDAMALKTETANIGGGEVIVSEVTAETYLSTFNDASVKDSDGNLDGGKFGALLAVRSIQDEKGHRIFDDKDAVVLTSKSTTAFTAIVEAVKKVNGIGAEIKNSETSPTDN